MYENRIEIPEGRSGRFAVRHVHHPAGWKAVTANWRCAVLGGQPSEEVVFDHPTRWHRLVEYDSDKPQPDEEGGVWMSDYPIEQAQHVASIRGMQGDVLVGGLGLGLVATMLSEMPEVRRVVVVEKQPEVIALVWPHLNVPNAEVVCADLFEFLKGNTHYFDHGFYDIWQSDGEGTFFKVVVPLRQLSAAYVNEVRCWNEDVMRGQLVHSLQFCGMMLDPAKRELIKLGWDPAEWLNDPHAEDDMWIRWRLPFLRKLQAAGEVLAPAQINDLAQVYAGMYGHTGWEAAWDQVHVEDYAA